MQPIHGIDPILPLWHLIITKGEVILTTRPKRSIRTLHKDTVANHLVHPLMAARDLECFGILIFFFFCPSSTLPSLTTLYLPLNSTSEFESKFDKPLPDQTKQTHFPTDLLTHPPLTHLTFPHGLPIAVATAKNGGREEEIQPPAHHIWYSSKTGFGLPTWPAYLTCLPNLPTWH